MHEHLQKTDKHLALPIHPSPSRRTGLLPSQQTLLWLPHHPFNCPHLLDDARLLAVVGTLLKFWLIYKRE